MQVSSLLIPVGRTESPGFVAQGVFALPLGSCSRSASAAQGRPGTDAIIALGSAALGWPCPTLPARQSTRPGKFSLPAWRLGTAAAAPSQFSRFRLLRCFDPLLSSVHCTPPRPLRSLLSSVFFLFFAATSTARAPRAPSAFFLFAPSTAAISRASFVVSFAVVVSHLALLLPAVFLASLTRLPPPRVRPIIARRPPSARCLVLARVSLVPLEVDCPPVVPLLVLCLDQVTWTGAG
jgi:hypothetical protein